MSLGGAYSLKWCMSLGCGLQAHKTSGSCHYWPIVGNVFLTRSILLSLSRVQYSKFVMFSF